MCLQPVKETPLSQKLVWPIQSFDWGLNNNAGLVESSVSLTGFLTLSFFLGFRVPEICAFTSQHNDPLNAQLHGASPTTGLAIPNGGLQVVNPSMAVYNVIINCLQNPSSTSNYEFADQSLLADLFPGRWVALPYIYNALKTLRWKGVHDAIWKDEKVKNIHYILSPKPWDKDNGDNIDETHEWWRSINNERLKAEKMSDVPVNGF